MPGHKQGRSDRSHFVAQFHLAGFTPSGKKKDSLFVHDTIKYESRQQGVPVTAVSVGLYEVENANIPSDQLEKLFGHYVEGPIAPIILRVCRTKELPESKDEFVSLIGYLSFAFNRTPTIMRSGDDVMTQVKDWLDRMGRGIRKSIERNQGKLELAQNDYVLQLLQFSLQFVPVMLQRKWHVVPVDPSIGHLVCTDNPVAVVGGGIGMRGTQIVCALDKSTAIAGSFEGKPRYVINDVVHLAAFNSILLSRIDRFAYSTFADFVYLEEDGKVCGAKQFLRSVEAQRWLLKRKDEREKGVIRIGRGLA